MLRVQSSLMYVHLQSTCMSVYRHTHDIMCICIDISILGSYNHQSHHNMHIQDTVDLDAQVEKLPPFLQIVALRSDMAEEQFFIAVEKHVLLESRCINTALLDMMSVYFTFDIAYPNPLYSLLLFIQRFVLNIRDSQPVPNNVTVLVTALSKSQLDYIVVLD